MSRTLRWVLGGLGDLLVTAGAVLLLFVAWQLWWTDVVADRDQAGTVQALSGEFAREPAAGPGAAPVPDAPVVVRSGEAFGVLRIPRFGPDYARPVLEGTDPGTLRRGIGHYTGTAGAGQVGNMGLAGHRTTYGRPFHDIDRLRGGDTIVVETVAGFAVYAVVRHAVVAPGAVEVLAPQPPVPGAAGTVDGTRSPAGQVAGGWLTLTACHPKYSAVQRYVVWARLTELRSRAQGPPPGVRLGATPQRPDGSLPGEGAA